MENFVVDVGSARLAGSEWSSDRTSSGVIVALHAGVADRRAWTGCAPGWASDGWRVVAYDRRGFGDSTWRAEPHDHVADLVAVVDERHIDRAVLVGNSMGGGLAIDFALAHPGRVQALVLVGSAVTGESPVEDVGTEAEQALDSAIGAAEDAGDLDEVNRLECHYWLDGPEQAEGRVGGEVRQRFLSMNRRALTAPDVGERRSPPDAWPRLEKIAVPTLVVAGVLDERMILAFADRLTRDIPGAHLVQLPDSAHLPSLDDTQRFTSVVADFLSGLIEVQPA